MRTHYPTSTERARKSISRRRLLELFLPMLTMLCLFGCRTAGRITDGEFLAAERFSFRLPAEKKWHLQLNRRSFAKTEVVFKRRGGGAWFRLRVTPLEKKYARVPMDILGQQIFVKEALRYGGTPSIDAIARILLDEREAIALLGARIDRPTIWKVSTILIRSQDHLLSVTFRARPDLFEPLSPDFERLLRHFKVLLPGDFDPFRLGDLPMGAPGPSPGNSRLMPPSPHVPLISPNSKTPPLD